MRKYFVIALALFSVVVLLTGGCSDRGTYQPAGMVSDLQGEWGVWPNVDWAFRTSHLDAPGTSPQFLFQLRNPDALLTSEIFIPREAFPLPQGEGRRVPLLILLAPMDGDQYFYRDRGLFELATEMVASGEIQPMIIMTIGNDPTFGGYFYGNSYGSGFYDGIIADTTDRGLLALLYDQLGELLLDSPDKRGIGGIGQGAYGAFRHAMKNPGVYSSIAAADGPLSFDGLADLFDDAITEQEARWVSKGHALPFDIHEFDTLVTMPVSRMFVGGSLSFSPNDLFVEHSIHAVCANPPCFGRPDTVHIISRDQWANDTILVPPDPTNTTLVWHMITESEGDWDFHVPFDATGAVHQPTWDRWLENDLATIMTDQGAGVLDGVNIWLGTSTQARWGFGQMTEDWATTLTSADHKPEMFRYQGYTGNPAETNGYVYDLLKEMLIFHSDNFGTD